MMIYKELFDQIYRALNDSILKYNPVYTKNDGNYLTNECESRTFLLMDFFYGINKTNFFFKKNDVVNNFDKNQLDTLIFKINLGLPIQHITGVQNFYGFDFYVNENVLIPRLDTEILVEWILDDFNDMHNFENKKFEVLDMCTGSGCIAISLLKKKADWVVEAADISEAALDVAALNAKRLAVDLKLIKSDLFSEINKKYDIIVSNPPYIESDVIETLDDEVKKYEPLIALDGGNDGLDFYREISRNAATYLKKGGAIYFEIGYNQGPSVKEILVDNNFKDVRIKKDLAGHDRCVSGKLC